MWVNIGFSTCNNTKSGYGFLHHIFKNACVLFLQRLSTVIHTVVSYGGNGMFHIFYDCNILM